MVIFIIAILLPSLVLSYIGLQSVRQEQYRQEEIHLRNLEQYLAIAISRVEAEMEESLNAIMNTLPVYGAMTNKLFYQQVRHVITQFSLVEDIFLLDQDFRVFYPRKHLADYFVDHRVSFQRQEIYMQATAFEARGMLEEAIAQYRQGLEESGSDVFTMALMNGIARCHLKMQNLSDARAGFRQIIDLDRGRFLGREVPFVLLAYHHLVDIEAKFDLPGVAMNTMLDFYGLLSDNFQFLGSAQHAFYISRVRGRIEERLSGASQVQVDRYLEIKEREGAAEAERSFRLAFDSYILPACRANFQLSRDVHELRFLRLQASEELFMIAMKAGKGEPIGYGIKGILLHKDETKQLLTHVVQSINIQDGTNFSLIQPGNGIGGLDIVSENRYILTSGFSSIRDLFPGYGIGINLQENPDFANLFRRTANLYYILFAGITGIILFGIVFIFRDISREQQFSGMKSAFLANVSHEIKNPVATIKVLAGNLAEGLITKQERQRAYFKLINREAEKLSHLAENFLDFSGVEAGRKIYRKEMINLHDLLLNVLGRFHLMHQNEHLVIHEAIPSGLPDILASPEGIEQAVLNLLDNAAKYSGKSNSIWLSLEQNENEVVISVTDKGIGISKAEQEKIFEKFYRVNNTEMKVPGSGVGLSLAREIALLHKGSIEVESEPGKGSRFSLKIPVHHAKDTVDRG